MTAKNWLPDFYEHVTGETLTAATSSKRAEQEFIREHVNDWIGRCAYGDWHEKVPAGFVGVIATWGVRNLCGPERAFLIPKGEYDAPRQFGYVVDRSTAREWLDHGLKLERGAA